MNCNVGIRLINYGDMFEGSDGDVKDEGLGLGVGW